MKKPEAPKLLKVRVNDHAACATDLESVPKQWVSAYHFEIHPEYKAKIASHVKSGVLTVEPED